MVILMTNFRSKHNLFRNESLQWHTVSFKIPMNYSSRHLLNSILMSPIPNCHFFHLSHRIMHSKSCFMYYMHTFLPLFCDREEHVFAWWKSTCLHIVCIHIMNLCSAQGNVLPIIFDECCVLHTVCIMVKRKRNDFSVSEKIEVLLQYDKLPKRS